MGVLKAVFFWVRGTPLAFDRFTK
ncbi:hypothetical protein HPSH_04815 [Helicobacter pylori Shi470]|nr:hypothetical protein HPSH_04815 [Helicobacter pylori Shi470]